MRKEQGNDNEDQDHSQDAFKQGAAYGDGDKGTSHGAGKGKEGELRAFLELMHFTFMKRSNGKDILYENGHAVCAIG